MAGLDLAAAVQHLLQHCLSLEAALRRSRSPVLRIFFSVIREKACARFQGCDGTWPLASAPSMLPVGIEFDLVPLAHPPKKLTAPPAAHHFHRPLPGLGTSHGLDDHVGTAAFSSGKLRL